MSKKLNRVGAVALVAVCSMAAGCGYMGSAKAIDPEQFDLDPGWISVKDIQLQRQVSDNDCGAASLAMVLTHWGLPATPQEITAACPPSEQGNRAGSLRDLVRNRGLKGFLIHGTLDDLNKELSAKRPVVVGLVKPYINGGMTHYEVVVAINPWKKLVATLDPARGPRQNTYEGFLQEWEPAGSLTLVVIGKEAPREPVGQKP
jgi:ABC-type bacteriocin/lantibiotic exporter with double-glycine peptidase domain